MARVTPQLQSVMDSSTARLMAIPLRQRRLYMYIIELARNMFKAFFLVATALEATVREFKRAESPRKEASHRRWLFRTRSGTSFRSSGATTKYGDGSKGHCYIWCPCLHPYNAGGRQRLWPARPPPEADRRYVLPEIWDHAKLAAPLPSNSSCFAWTVRVFFLLVLVLKAPLLSS